MGIYGRDYMREDTPSPPMWLGWSVTTKLIIVNAALWFLFAGSMSWGGERGGLFGFITDTLLLHPEDVFGRLRLWQPFTAFWFHDPSGLGHIFFNMLFLWFFGRPTEVLIGRRAFFRLYVLAGLASTLALTAYGLLANPILFGLGASGCVYGVGVFLAMRQPHLPVIFFVIRMPLWFLVGVFMVGREVVNLLVLHQALGTTIGHLAGAAYGLLAHRTLRTVPSDSSGGLLDGLRQRMQQSKERKAQASERDVRTRVDELLEKIHTDGIGSLTEAEKDFLEGASGRFGH